MAPDVIDLVSSSPPLPTLRRPAETAAPSTVTGIGQDHNGRLRSPELFVSSDFDVPDDELLGQSPRNAKRLRISTSPLPRAAVDPPRAAQPPFLSTTSNRQNRLEFDPIEFTSSLDPDAPRPQQNVIDHSIAGAPAARPHKPKPTTQDPLQISLGSDPFASSPLLASITSAKQRPEKPEKPEQHTTTIADEFADAFASSPLPLLPPPSRGPHRPKEQTTAIHTIIDVDDFSDPFISSQNANLQPAKIPTRRAVSVEVVEHSRKRKHWDPISSSAPEEPPRAPPQEKTLSDSQRTGPTVISIDSDSANSSEDEFPDIADFNLSRVRPRPRSPIRRSQSDVITSRSSRPRSTATATATAKTAEQRARDRDAQAAAKAAEKERKRLEKEQLKEAKALEKERAAALAEVNKVRTDKKVSTPEMILVIPSSVTEGLKVQLGAMLDGLSVEHTTWESPVANAFKWRRKVTSRFDEEMGRWEPIPPRIIPEKHALILLTAEEFVEMAVSDTLDSSVSEVKRHFPGHELIYILEGITPWMRKNRNLRNRRFAAGVRAQDQAAPEATPASRRRRNNATAEEYISESIVEDAMLQLQVEHEVLIHHTAAPLETAQWIVAFTQHISTIPYKKLREKLTSSAGFCMESGQVRTGDDARDTYVRMLQEIARVTAPIAYGIVSEFETVSKLVTGLEQGGPLRLEGVRKSANKDGAVSDRTVGQAVSRRIHKVFTGKDEMSTDV
ncbi:hypothetical protein TGAM01_v209225 [Trichoderma gamsii]|uniref:ERCC4 domain-containing protein n=1 Tax=Trichoderma gamsii TaxID=398673 RepID=A0A2P4ZCE5_9HYPO|nr:hypothetical protein TGAM01_v209225 [Trichoderma gamsii]PON21969.1 hypothetical protein TGAM01_v209225 [Trichoderma gamsii]